MLSLCLIFFSFYISFSDLLQPLTSTTKTTTEEVKEIFEGSRRILRGHSIFDTRRYMVYLRPTHTQTDQVDANWLCGGVIIHERYILTSAACIEDVKYFYVVSGTHKWIPESQNNECIRNGAQRAVWKCVRKTYRFDGRSFNNIRWMVNDIAVVMLEGAISFDRRVKGCDFIPHKISYNNISVEYENPGKKGFIAGWGSEDRYTDSADIISKTSVNSPVLLEAETIIITKDSCKSRWLERYHAIITDYMICGKVSHGIDMSEICDEKISECRQLMLSEEEGPRRRRFEKNLDKFILNSAVQVRKRRKVKKRIQRQMKTRRTETGGFCENDHGGPLVVGQGTFALVVGIMSAYKVENNSKLCYGPYLYTSVYNNRQLIHCALYKNEGLECPTLLRDDASVLEEETFDWDNVEIKPRTVYEDEDDQPEPALGHKYIPQSEQVTE